MKKFFRSFVHAAHGISLAYRGQRNIWVMSALGTAALMTGLLLKLDTASLAILLVLIALILSLEILNTALERLIDAIHPHWDRKIGAVKDLLSGAVLTASILALAVGGLLFIPGLIRMLRQ